MKGEKVKAFLMKAWRFISNPRLLLCVGVAWVLTNGWSYVLLAVGTYFDIAWMTGVAGAYVTFLWFPMSPEKVVTFFIAIGLMRWWFPGDQKTLAVLKNGLENAKNAVRRRRDVRKEKKAAKKSEQGR